MSQPAFEEMRRCVVDGDAGRARELARLVLESGGDPLPAIEQGFAAGIRRVGELWEEGEYFLPELVQGAEAMKAAMAVLHPALVRDHPGRRSKGRVVIGTVRGDLHDIGKSLVATLLAAHGFEVHDLGSDVAVDAFLEKAREVRAEIVAASALLTTTMTVQRELAEAVAAARLPWNPKMLVGGAPATAGWAERIGASYAENALQAVSVAERMIT